MSDIKVTKPSILLVEDEKNIRDALKLNLELEGYDVVTAVTGVEALDKVRQAYFDLIILDIMLPEMDGIAVCESIRINQNLTPILFLSAKNTSEDRVLGLKKGGDDYLVKPFNLEELLLRVDKLITKNTQINQQQSKSISHYSFKDFIIDFAAHEIRRGDKTIIMSKKETALLKLLIENEGQVISREHILQVVWGYQVFPTTRTIDNFILNFRKYFEEDSKHPAHFHSVRGVGYKFTI